MFQRKIKRWIVSLYRRAGSTRVDRQRMWVYVYIMLVLGIVAVVNSIPGVNIRATVFSELDVVYSLLSLGGFALFLCRRLSVIQGLVSFIVLSQVYHMMYMILLACRLGAGDTVAVIGHMVMLDVMLFVSVMAYLRYLPYV